MIEYIPYFQEASESCRKFGQLIKDYSFSEKDEPIELYTLTTLNLCKQHTKAITILFNESLYIGVMIILRNIVELFFNLMWIYEGENSVQKLERVYQLEGRAYLELEKEIMMMEDEKKNRYIEQ